MESPNPEEEPNRTLHPDELINKIFRLQQEREPHADPGNMTIGIQDDMALVEVSQDGREGTYYGFTLQDALESMLQSLEAQNDPPEATETLPPEHHESLRINPLTDKTEVWNNGRMIGSQG